MVCRLVGVVARASELQFGDGHIHGDGLGAVLARENVVGCNLAFYPDPGAFGEVGGDLVGAVTEYGAFDPLGFFIGAITKLGSYAEAGNRGSSLAGAKFSVAAEIAKEMGFHGLTPVDPRPAVPRVVVVKVVSVSAGV